MNLFTAFLVERLALIILFGFHFQRAGNRAARAIDDGIMFLLHVFKVLEEKLNAETDRH